MHFIDCCKRFDISVKKFNYYKNYNNIITTNIIITVLYYYNFNTNNVIVIAQIQCLLTKIVQQN